MGAGFHKGRRGLLKSTCALADAGAVVSIGGDAFVSDDFFAVDAPAVQVRNSGNSTFLLHTVSSDKIPADMYDETVDGFMAHPAMRTHLGYMLSNSDAPTKQFLCPCNDALSDPLKSDANTGGATSRTLPHIPLQAVDGKLVVAGEPSGHVGVTRG
jgi:hypothetical protein